MESEIQRDIREREEEWEQVEKYELGPYGERLETKENKRISVWGAIRRRARLERDLGRDAADGENLRESFKWCKDYYSRSREEGKKEIELVKRIQRGLKSSKFQNVFGEIVEDEFKSRNLIEKVIEFEASLLDDYREKQKLIEELGIDGKIPSYFENLGREQVQEAIRIILDMAHKFAATKITEATISQDVPELETLDEEQLEKFIEAEVLGILDSKKNGKSNDRHTAEIGTAEKS